VPVAEATPVPLAEAPPVPLAEAIPVPLAEATRVPAGYVESSASIAPVDSARAPVKT
jgi:hypothetical protein